MSADDRETYVLIETDSDFAYIGVITNEDVYLHDLELRLLIADVSWYKNPKHPWQRIRGDGGYAFDRDTITWERLRTEPPPSTDLPGGFWRG